MPLGVSRRAPARAHGGWRAVFWIAIIVLVIALAAIGAIFVSYLRGAAVYDDLAERSFSAPISDAGQAVSLDDLSVDWDALRAVNPDVVGWIYLPGTTINYPIVYSGDDTRYLIEDFYGETSPLVSYGAIFLSGENAPDFSDDNSIVYGHHLLNGEMFSPIAQMTDEAAFNDHRSVYLLTPEGNCRLVSYALVHVDPTDPIVQPDFASDEARAVYVRDKLDRSVVAADGQTVDPSDARTLFMLSTCDNLASNGRYVLCCYVAESTDPNIVAAAGAGAADGDAPVDPKAAGAIEGAADGAASA